MLKSCVCTQKQLQSKVFRDWAVRMKENPNALHRKLRHGRTMGASSYGSGSAATSESHAPRLQSQRRSGPLSACRILRAIPRRTAASPAARMTIADTVLALGGNVSDSLPRPMQRSVSIRPRCDPTFNAPATASIRPS